MAAFEDLPADQKAVLQLVIRQDRAYEDIAALLKISSEAVRERALTALDALGPDAEALSAGEQDDVGDYLLGQQGASARAATRELLETSAPARAWARGVAAELRAAELGGEDTLPEIPADEAEIDEAFGALQARHRAREEQERSSRLGGALLLGAAAVILTALILWAAGVFDTAKDDADPGRTATTATTTAATTTPSGATVEQQATLLPPDGSGSARGVVTVLRQDGRRLVAAVAQGLPTGTHYVLWLRNGEDMIKLGFFDPQAGSGATKGKLIGQAQAPTDLSGGEHQVLITHETSRKPTAPTDVLLQGVLQRAGTG
jgi:hypothetical protein